MRWICLPIFIEAMSSGIQTTDAHYWHNQDPGDADLMYMTVVTTRHILWEFPKYASRRRLYPWHAWVGSQSGQIHRLAPVGRDPCSSAKGRKSWGCCSGRPRAGLRVQLMGCCLASTAPYGFPTIKLIVFPS